MKWIPASSEPTLSSGYVLTGTVQVEEPEDGAPEAARFVWQLTGRDGLRYPTVQERADSTPAFLVALPFDRVPQSWLEAGTGNPM